MILHKNHNDWLFPTQANKGQVCYLPVGLSVSRTVPLFTLNVQPDNTIIQQART